MLTFQTWSGQGPITRREKGLFGVKQPYGEDKVLPTAKTTQEVLTQQTLNPWKEKELCHAHLKKKSKLICPQCSVVLWGSPRFKL